MKQRRKIEVRLNAREKTNFQKIARRVGLTMSGALHLFINKCLIQNGIPFKVQTRRLSREEESKLTPQEMVDYIMSLTDDD